MPEVRMNNVDVPPWNSRIYRRSSAVGLTVPAVINEFAAMVDVGVIAPVTT